MECLKCPICYENFSTIKVPSILPCGHSICSECVKKIKEESREDQGEFESLESSSENDSLLSNRSKSKSKKKGKDLFCEDEAEVIYLSDGEDELISLSNKSGSFYFCEEDEEEDDECDDDESDIESDEESNEEIDMNVIISKNEEENEENLQKFKFKCPYCSKRVKIDQKRIIVNTDILKLVKGKNNDNTSDCLIFCEKCRVVDNESNHIIKFNSSHMQFFKPMTLQTLQKIKENFNRFNENEMRQKAIDFLTQFRDSLFQDKKMLKDIQDNMSTKMNKFASLSHLKIKAGKKLAYFYTKFSEVLNKIDKKNPQDDEIEELEKYLNLAENIMSKYKTFLAAFECDELQEKTPFSKMIIQFSFKVYFMKSLLDGFLHSVLAGTIEMENQFSLYYDKKTKSHFIFDANIKRVQTIYQFANKNQYVNLKNYEINKDGTLIYFFGSQNDSSNQFVNYSPYERVFTVLKEMPQKFRIVDSLLYRNKIYIIGGEIDDTHLTNQCFEYSIESNTWKKLPSQKYKKKKKCVTCINCVIYTFGGKGRDISETYKFEVLDLNNISSGWECVKIEGYFEPIFNFGYYLYDEKTLFILGGDNQTNGDYDVKGYAINLYKKQLITSFDLKTIFVNKISMPTFYRGELFAKNNSLDDLDSFLLWEQLGKISITF